MCSKWNNMTALDVSSALDKNLQIRIFLLHFLIPPSVKRVLFWLFCIPDEQQSRDRKQSIIAHVSHFQKKSKGETASA